ncbi:MAG: RodZ domain-containing protein [Sneathiella sp.]
MAKKSRPAGGNNEPSLFSNRSAQASRLNDLGDEQTEAYEEEVETVGTRLRLAREDRGWSLHDVAAMLRLKAPQIQALENGNYDQLPGQTFVTGFLRSYANLLDLDAVAIVDMYKHEHSDGLRTPSLAFPEPTSEGRIPGTGMLLGTLMLSLVLIAGWFVYQESSSLDFERVADIPDHLADKVKAALAEDDISLQSGNLNEAGSTEVQVAPDSSVETSLDDAEMDTVLPTLASEVVTSTKPMDEAAATTNGVLAELERDNRDISAIDTAVTSAATETDVPQNTETVAVVTPLGSAAQATTQELEASNNTAPTSTFSPEAIVEPEKVAVNQVKTEQLLVEERPIDPSNENATSNYPQAVLDKSVEVVDEIAESPLPRTFGIDNTTARVVLRARAETWIEIKPADGAPYLSRVLKPGDVYMAPDIPNLKMTTGNAGGLEIRVDGNEIASLGGNGTILRDIPLVADSLLSGTSVNQ